MNSSHSLFVPFLVSTNSGKYLDLYDVQDSYSLKVSAQSGVKDNQNNDLKDTTTL